MAHEQASWCRPLLVGSVCARSLMGLATLALASLVTPWQPFPVPREMTVEEIKTCVEQFRQGALKCMEAGFDGVEVGDRVSCKARPGCHARLIQGVGKRGSTAGHVEHGQ